jgi:hypothetical protein
MVTIPEASFFNDLDLVGRSLLFKGEPGRV